MIVTGVPGATADPVVALALAALQIQAEGLTAASGRLARCGTAVPSSADDTWQGPARIAYEAGLAHLRQLVVAAAASVDDAIAETRRAVTTMQQGIG